MQLAAIETFLTIIEVGSLSRAAERLNVTQSTVNARLTGLENTLGQKLFTRRKSGAELTYAGFSFQRHAQLMSDVWSLAQRESSLPPDTTSVCNIGCHFDMLTGLGKKLMDSITTTHPDVALSAWPGEQRDLDHWLDIGLVDAAICFSPTVHDTTTAYPIMDDELVLVSSLSYGEDYVAHMQDVTFVYADNGEEFRRLYAATFPDRSNPAITFGCAEWALEHIRTIGGAAYMPRRLVPDEAFLSMIETAPVFHRAATLVVNDRMATEWSWLPSILETVQSAARYSPAD
ncbi:MAG: LysR family transcriptional regulator [Rhodospirillales bacterium]|nr:LysR family transcriptional regulator [Rhodospirillales bacterium]